MNYATLADELAQARYTGLTDREAADDLNTPRLDALRPLDSRQLLAWAAGSDRIMRIRAAQGTGGAASRNRASAADVLIMRDNAALDLNDPEHAGLVEAMLADGVITSDERDDLHARATVQISRAQELGLGRVTWRQVQRARARSND